MNLRSFLITSLFFVIWQVHAQDYTINLQTFDVEEGLLHRRAHIVFEDKDGIIWIGSDKGLQRFDGHDFKAWTAKSKPLGKMAYITAISQDQDGWLWLWNNHILEFVFLHTQTNEVLSQEEKFGADFPFKRFSNEKKSGWKGGLGLFQMDSQGRQYFVSNNPHELFVYDAKKGFSRHSLEEITDQEIDLELVDSKGSIWISGSNGNPTLYKVDATGNLISQYDLSKKGTSIHALTEWNRAIYLILNNSGFFSHYKIDSTGNLTWLRDKPLKQKQPTHINDFTWDYYQNNAFVYIGYDLTKPIFDLNLNSIPKQFSDNPGSIFKDSQKRYWFYNNWGVGLATIKPNLFKRYFYFKKDIDKPINNSARGILVENDTIYANFEFGGLVSIPQKNPRQWSIINPIKTNERYYGRPLAKAEQGGFYVGYNSNLIQYVDPAADVKTNLTFLEKSEFLPSAAWSFYTAPDQKLWIGMDQGIAYKNPQEDYLQLISYTDSLSHENIIYHICSDEDGNLWISGKKRLCRFDPDTKSFLEIYEKSAQGKSQIPVESFYYLYIDPDGIFWLGTNDGLLRWDRKTNEQRLFTTINGLSNDVIYAIFEDDYNNLWLSSDYGIMQFNKETFHVNTFLEKDGITHQEFNRTSAFKAEDGTIYFGGLNGITAFHPKDFRQITSEAPAHMMISDFEIFDGESAQLLNKVGSLRTTNTINFHPDDRFFRLTFSLPSFENAKKVNYAWQIEGVDKDWNYQKENSIQVGKLPYGQHTLKIKGQNHMGQWSPYELAIRVNVLKPFYLQLWFIALSFVALVLGVRAILNWRTRRLKRNQILLKEEIQKATTKIEKQAEELKQLDQVKSRFFANVSHELRTPLTLILGPINSVLKRNELKNQDFTHLKKAQQSGKDLLKLVASILNLSKMESGKLDLIEKPVLLFPLIRRIVSAFESHAQREGVQFSFEYLVEKNLQLELDKEKLEIIFNNLLSNAIKFTQAGGEISVKVEDMENAIQLIVADNGRGIHEKDLPFVFDRFYQSRQADAPTEGGTGIGLALSQELIKIMGGKVWVESEFGKGSTFFVRLPRKEILGALIHPEQMSVEPPEQTAKVANSAEKEKGVNEGDHRSLILIVEDNYSLRDYLQSILSPAYKIWTAENGLAALNLLKENQETLPALVISDVMMPVMDGFQFLTALKSKENYKHLPVIMLTARADIQDKIKALRIGVDDYLLKPFEEEELLIRIENLLSNYQERLEAQAEHNNAPSEERGNLSGFKEQTPIVTLEDQEWLEALENHLKQQISNSQYTVSQFAYDLNISERQLRRRTKTLIGLSPTQYLKEIRMQAARQLLEQRRYKTVAQVASMVGFQDAGAFTRNFSKRFGKSPSEYLFD